VAEEANLPMGGPIPRNGLMAYSVLLLREKLCN
jgi:hypothetical protein